MDISSLIENVLVVSTHSVLVPRMSVHLLDGPKDRMNFVAFGLLKVRILSVFSGLSSEGGHISRCGQLE
jgi:hypothetical protein